ncbi:c-type cytochrome biogenesis protein CcmI [Mesorhizobium loti]|nr:c-type cytochrome biogenesis protein CcmI [Mesorhizobium loti]PLP59710.1 c-type cytochrome biogenesis protein CcmI [Mesorhizobium loti]
MLFWVIAAVLTLGASLAVLLPLAGGARGEHSQNAHDLEVYRDQLGELDRDLERGLIQPAEAEQARAEIGRRIIRLGSNETAAQAAGSGSKAVRLLSVFAVLAVPLLSWGIYARLGSPDLPSQPLAERLAKNPADSSVDELVARAEAHLVKNPTDGRGWDVLAPIYLRIGRFGDAVTAYRNAIRLEGVSAARQTGLGEAIVNGAGGVVSAEAQEAFEAAIKLDPNDPKANFYLALAFSQEGRKPEALATLQKMQATLPADSPWRKAVEQALTSVGGNPAPSASGPSQEEATAASSLSDEQRSAMIETMVASLDEKLKQNPRDTEGWMRLIRSYVVLGKTDEARAALRRGIAVFGADSPEAKQFVAFAGTLGLAATE